MHWELLMPAPLTSRLNLETRGRRAPRAREGVELKRLGLLHGGPPHMPRVAPRLQLLGGGNVIRVDDNNRRVRVDANGRPAALESGQAGEVALWRSAVWGRGRGQGEGAWVNRFSASVPVEPQCTAASTREGDARAVAGDVPQLHSEV